jgi:hypothetical protein
MFRSHYIEWCMHLLWWRFSLSGIVSNYNVFISRDNLYYQRAVERWRNGAGRGDGECCLEHPRGTQPHCVSLTHWAPTPVSPNEIWTRAKCLGSYSQHNGQGQLRKQEDRIRLWLTDQKPECDDSLLLITFESCISWLSQPQRSTV